MNALALNTAQAVTHTLPPFSVLLAHEAAAHEAHDAACSALGVAEKIGGEAEALAEAAEGEACDASVQAYCAMIDTPAPTVADAIRKAEVYRARTPVLEGSEILDHDGMMHPVVEARRVVDDLLRFIAQPSPAAPHTDENRWDAAKAAYEQARADEAAQTGEDDGAAWGRVADALSALEETPVSTPAQLAYMIREAIAFNLLSYVHQTPDDPKSIGHLLWDGGAEAVVARIYQQVLRLAGIDSPVLHAVRAKDHPFLGDPEGLALVAEYESLGGRFTLHEKDDEAWLETLWPEKQTERSVEIERLSQTDEMGKRIVGALRARDAEALS